MWDSEVPIPVWILGFFAYCIARAAASISSLTARVKAQTVAFLTAFEIASTDEKNVSLLYLTNDPAQKIIEIETSQSKLHNAV